MINETRQTEAIEARQTEAIEAMTAAFYQAVEDLWNTRRSDFIKIPLMSQEASTAYAITRGMEAAFKAVLPLLSNRS